MGKFNFRPLYQHPQFAVSLLVQIVGWLTAFISQCSAEAKYHSNGGKGTAVGVPWYGIVVQLLVDFAVLTCIVRSNMHLYRWQMCLFLAVALVMAVLGTNEGIYGSSSPQLSMGVGWIMVAVIDNLWLLYFSAHDDSILIKIMDKGAATSLALGHRRGKSGSSKAGSLPFNEKDSATNIPGASVINFGNSDHGGYLKDDGASADYSTHYGQSSAVMNRGPNEESFHDTFPASSTHSPAQPQYGTQQAPSFEYASQQHPSQASTPGLQQANAQPQAQPSLAPTSAGMAPTYSNSSAPSRSPNASYATSPDPAQSVVIAPTAVPAPAPTMSPQVIRARALYAYTASADDPNEMSFAKGDVLTIIDHSGKWWQATAPDGTTRIVPSNYLTVI